MYVPAHFALGEHAAIAAFMKRFNFAAIVSQVEGLPFATHLPFAVETEADGRIGLLAHFARKNPQWNDLASQTALVIFSEPHAYVSPSLYEKEQNVPTWNYIAVHAYVRAIPVEDEAEALALLERQMQHFEAAYLDQWARLSDDYKHALVKGIAAFRFSVEKLEGKHKLSQNKSPRDRANVAGHLQQSEDGAARQIAEYMKTLYDL